MHVQAEWSIQLGLVKYIWVCGPYIMVYCSDNDSSNYQKPISHRNVDLAVEYFACIAGWLIKRPIRRLADVRLIAPKLGVQSSPSIELVASI
jgi:hypothetical protein